ncbi:hypothetical protein VitviT2T_007403 [Vitis vinifera]|uniref:Ankyrin repeat-containing protein n=1 Tax=Vitis vinifera TaxID=29760 RepID=A0ABY9BZ50_VITVI|nr:hypothetical protein VitviT2T_007403 [Vitis vinifera]
MEWGNLAMRTSEEPTDCPIVSKITHRYVPDSPIESDRIMRLPAGVPEGARKPAEEMTDSEVQTKTVNLQVVEDFSKDSERFPITRAMEVEMLQKQSGEKKVDVSAPYLKYQKKLIRSAKPQNLNLDSSSHIEMLDQVTADDAQYGKVDGVRWILGLPLCSSLLQLPNLRGDTLLHLAARKGYIDVVVALFDGAKAVFKEMESEIGTDKVMLRMTNMEEDTAFHEAVRYDHPDIVELLIQKDLEFTYGANITSHTPLCIYMYNTQVVLLLVGPLIL